MKLVRADQMQQVDREAIDNRGIPSDELMENAGSGIAEAILEQLLPEPEEAAVAVFCGKGNNGGDGFVVARSLHEEGANVDVYFIGPVEKLSDDAYTNYERANNAGMRLIELKDDSDLPEFLEADLIIEALFGTGFSGSPRGLAGEVIEYINKQELPVVSVDMPSGLNADNGQHEGAVIDADYTFTLALPKYGLYLSPGRELSGIVDIIDIGIPEDVVDKFDLTSELISFEEVAARMPKRPPTGHKGTFGKLFILAGSTGLTGAAEMAAMSALRSGCGLVQLACPKEVQPVMAMKLMEATTHPLPDVGKKGKLALRGLGEIRKLLEAQDAAIIGPGIGRHHETFELIRRLVSNLETPAIIDADGLNALAEDIDYLKACPSTPVLTPHPGEFKRLVNERIPGDIEEAADLVRDVANELGIVLVLKGSPTLVAGPRSNCYLNPTGNHGMATGGSGDVLSGIIGSFLAQGLEPLDAAIVGVYVHGLAGDIAADELTPRAMIPGDMIDMLPEVYYLFE